MCINVNIVNNNRLHFPNSRWLQISNRVASDGDSDHFDLLDNK